MRSFDWITTKNARLAFNSDKNVEPFLNCFCLDNFWRKICKWLNCSTVFLMNGFSAASYSFLINRTPWTKTKNGRKKNSCNVQFWDKNVQKQVKKQLKKSTGKPRAWNPLIGSEFSVHKSWWKMFEKYNISIKKKSIDISNKWTQFQEKALNVKWFLGDRIWLKRASEIRKQLKQTFSYENHLQFRRFLNFSWKSKTSLIKDNLFYSNWLWNIYSTFHCI